MWKSLPNGAVLSSVHMFTPSNPPTATTTNLFPFLTYKPHELVRYSPTSELKQLITSLAIVLRGPLALQKNWGARLWHLVPSEFPGSAGFRPGAQRQLGPAEAAEPHGLRGSGGVPLGRPRVSVLCTGATRWDLGVGFGVELGVLDNSRSCCFLFSEGHYHGESLPCGSSWPLWLRIPNSIEPWPCQNGPL